ncbi:MAG: ABC transporter permease, partial [bacterium]
VLITIASVGMVFALQIALEFVRFGAGKFAGAVMAIALARELAPILTGVVIAARVGASITAEIGTMKVTEQVDALTALGSNPIKYLVVPRLIACMVMLPLLTIFSMIIGFYGAYFVSTAFVKINPTDYMSSAQNLLKYPDVYGGLIKTIIFGMLIAVIACYKGLNAEGGAKGVGEATTSTVVTSLISIFIANYFLSILFFR